MNSPEATIAAYIEATRFGDVAALRALFASTALMSGYFEGEFYSGSPELFFEEVRDNPSPVDTANEYRGEITHIEVIGDIATVTMKEKGYLGLDFTNLFHLARVGENWLILGKTYVDE